MPSRNQHLPDFIYHELYNWAHENRISYQQLMYEILRDGIEKRRGKKCAHNVEDRKFSRNKKQWYCRACFTFLEVTVIKGGLDYKARKPIWEQTMSKEEWSGMIKPNNEDLK